jgi:hypothetical protein
MKFFEKFWLIWGKDSVDIYHMKRCVYFVWSGCLRVVHLSCHKGQWLPGWVWTYLMVREGTECLCCFFNCVGTPRSAYVHTVFPILHRILWNQFWILSDSLHLLSPATHLPLQRPHVDHSCVNQVIKNSKLPFFGSQFSEKSRCISSEQVNILDVAAVQTQ